MPSAARTWPRSRSVSGRISRWPFIPMRSRRWSGEVIAFPVFIRRFVRVLPLAALVLAYAFPAAAQSRPARFLGREEILLYGIGLKVEPAHQTVPKDIATIVSTYLQTAAPPDGVPPFAPDAVVKATLRGPGFATPRELT